jgi:hypothetical protein
VIRYFLVGLICAVAGMLLTAIGAGGLLYTAASGSRSVDPQVNTYAKIQALGLTPSVTVAHDMIHVLRAQDVSRRNGYAWSDSVVNDVLRVKLNVWILEKIGEPLLPVGQDRPAEPTNPKNPRSPIEGAGAYR